LSARLAEAGIAEPDIEEEPTTTSGEVRAVGAPEDGHRNSAESSPPMDRPVIVVDQFEETFTLCSDEQERYRFIRKLCALATTRTADTGPALVVLGLRAEFTHRCTTYQELEGALRALVPLVPMKRDELRAAIEKPAAVVNLNVEAGLVDTLLDDFDIPKESGGVVRGVHGAGALPLLAHTLRATWQVGRGHGLTLSRYQAIGSIRDAIEKTADQVYEQLDAAGQQTARWLLLRLIKLSDDTQTRLRLDLRQLVEDSPYPAARDVLEKLADARLVTLAKTTAEIAHDVLLRAWPQLRKWIDEDRAGLLLQQRLRDDADDWLRAGKDSSRLYRGSRLADVLALVKTVGHDGDLTQLASEFLDASETAERLEQERERMEQERERRRTRRLRRTNILLVCSIVVAIIATGLFWLQRQRANEQRDEALSSQLAGEADALLQSRSELALLLSIQAFRIHPGTDSRDNLLSTQAHYYAARIQTSSPATDVAFRPDGRTIAVSTQNRVDEWNAVSRRYLRAVKAGPSRSSGTGAASFFYGVAYSPDGHVLAIARQDGGVDLWDDRDHKARALPREGQDQDRGPINGVAFSPDGRIVAGAGHDGVVRLWDTRTRSDPEIVGPPGNSVPVEAVAFSPDGRTLAAVGADSMVAVWDLSSRTVTRMGGHVGPVRSVAFSPDGRVLASGGEDASVRLWDVRSRNLLTPLTGPIGAVTKVTFSPDGGALAAAGADSSVGFWRLGALGLGGPHLLRAVTIRPGGSPLLASADAAGAIRLWDVRTGRHVAILQPHDQEGPDRPINTIAFSRSGRLLVAAEDEGIAVWDISSGAEGAGLTARRRTELSDEETGPIAAVAISPDERTVAGASDRTLTFWDVATRDVTGSLTPHPSRINVVAFSPDGRTIATGSDDRAVSLTRVPTPSGGAQSTSSNDCSGHLGPVRAVAFSPRGDLLASASADHTVKLWNPTSCELIRTFAGHTQAVAAVAFDSGGGRLASAGLDEHINVWNTAAGGDTVTDRPSFSLRARSGATSLMFGPASDELMSVDSSDGTEVTIVVTTEGLSSLDLYADGRPIGTSIVLDGINQLTAPLTKPAEVTLRIDGYHESKLVASRKVTLDK
jgi:WD40 repeat protein